MREVIMRLTPKEFENAEYAEILQELVRCKDCKYFGEADSDEPEYHECNYFSDWSTVHYMLENDYCSCAKRKDEVKE